MKAQEKHVDGNESRRRAPPHTAQIDGRHRRGAEARNTVLRHAMDVASIGGLDGVTIGRLADDLGISKGNITTLFASKEELQLKTLDGAVEIFIEEVVRPAMAAVSPLPRLSRLCEAWFEYVDRRVFPGGCMLYATTNEYRARPGPIQDRVNHHRHAWNQLLVSTAQRALEAKELKAGTDVDQLVFELTSYQSLANTAALLGDQALFERARRTSRTRIASTERG
ncbi:MAG TPA: TetR/AcrR family transcriptional regulator [Ramlibacter sp.]|nr:TetR/AcrR family transcriptional regulator [Ramlibacter sp.]